METDAEADDGEEPDAMEIDPTELDPTIQSRKGTAKRIIITLRSSEQGTSKNKTVKDKVSGAKSAKVQKPAPKKKSTTKDMVSKAAATNQVRKYSKPGPKVGPKAPRQAKSMASGRKAAKVSDKL